MTTIISNESTIVYEVDYDQILEDYLEGEVELGHLPDPSLFPVQRPRRVRENYHSFEENAWVPPRMETQKKPTHNNKLSDEINLESELRAHDDAEFNDTESPFEDDTFNSSYLQETQMNDIIAETATVNIPRPSTKATKAEISEVNHQLEAQILDLQSKLAQAKSDTEATKQRNTLPPYISRKYHWIESNGQWYLRIRDNIVAEVQKQLPRTMKQIRSNISEEQMAKARELGEAWAKVGDCLYNLADKRQDWFLRDLGNQMWQELTKVTMFWLDYEQDRGTRNEERTYGFMRDAAAEAYVFVNAVLTAGEILNADFEQSNISPDNGMYNYFRMMSSVNQKNYEDTSPGWVPPAHTAIPRKEIANGLPF